MYSHKINIRFLDINAGNHVSSHKILDYIIDGINVFFINKGFSLNDFLGTNFILSNSTLDFKKEIKIDSDIFFNILSIEFRKKSIIILIEIKGGDGDVYVKSEIKGVFLNKDGVISAIDDNMRDCLL